MNKYFIAFGAVALSFGAVCGAKANLGEPPAIDGASVPVDAHTGEAVPASTPDDEGMVREDTTIVE